MADIRRDIARIVERHLEEILDRTMETLVAEVPAVTRQDDAGRARVRASTKHATLAFLAVFSDPESPARVMLDEARRATVDRAGEIFQRDEILSIIAVARHVIFHSARDIVLAERGADAETEREVAVAMEAFLTELERDETIMASSRDPVDDLLRAAEREDADLG